MESSELDRLDVLLVNKGFCKTRSQARDYIINGWIEILVSGQPLKNIKPSTVLKSTDFEVILCTPGSKEFVSRAGFKLDHILQSLGIAISGKICLDIGQSTGGFTDCLLQRGAATVYGVDVGQGQLDIKLHQNPRVVAQESFNVLAEHSWPHGFPAKFDCICMDVSFCSQLPFYGIIAKSMRMGGRLISLVKPQFELGPGKVLKEGRVKSEEQIFELKNKMTESLGLLGFSDFSWHKSAIKGGEGTEEYFLVTTFVEGSK